MRVLAVRLTRDCERGSCLGPARREGSPSVHLCKKGSCLIHPEAIFSSGWMETAPGRYRWTGYEPGGGVDREVSAELEGSGLGYTYRKGSCPIHSEAKNSSGWMKHEPENRRWAGCEPGNDADGRGRTRDARYGRHRDPGRCRRRRLPGREPVFRPGGRRRCRAWARRKRRASRSRAACA